MDVMSQSNRNALRVISAIFHADRSSRTGGRACVTNSSTCVKDERQVVEG